MAHGESEENVLKRRQPTEGEEGNGDLEDIDTNGGDVDKSDEDADENGKESIEDHVRFGEESEADEEQVVIEPAEGGDVDGAGAGGIFEAWVHAERALERSGAPSPGP